MGDGAIHPPFLITMMEINYKERYETLLHRVKMFIDALTVQGKLDSNFFRNAHRLMGQQFDNPVMRGWFGELGNLIDYVKKLEEGDLCKQNDSSTP